MNIYLTLSDNSVATRIELGTYEVDFLTMAAKITVLCYDEFGNRVGTLAFPHQLTDFPTPNSEQQWEIVIPLIEQMQQNG